MATADVINNTMRSSYELGLLRPKPTFAQTLRRKSTLIARKYLNTQAPRSNSYLNSTYDLEPYMNNDEFDLCDVYPVAEPEPYSYMSTIVDTRPSFSYYTTRSLDRKNDTPITQRLFSDDYISRPLDCRKVDNTTPLALRGVSSSLADACRGSAKLSSFSNVLSSSKETPSTTTRLPSYASPAPSLYLRSHSSNNRSSAALPPPPPRPSRTCLGSTCTYRELSKIITEPSGGEYVIPHEPFNEVYPGLFVGDMATALCTAALVSMGITHVLNAAQKDPHGQQLPGYYVNTNAAYYRHANIKFLGVPATDVIDFDLSQYFDISADFIDDALKSNGKVLVHCHQGISRSAALAIAFLMLRRGMTAQEAMRTVRAKREVIPNQSFLRQLCELNDKLLGVRTARFSRYLS